MPDWALLCQNCKRDQVQGLKESLLAIRGERGSGPCLLRECFDKSRLIVPIALLVRVKRSMKNLYKAVEGPSTIPIVLLMITESYFRPWLLKVV